MVSFFRFLFSPILYLLSLLYRFLFQIDRFLKKQKRLPNAIVLSVGNFSVGGTGKTPFTLHLAHLLHTNFPEIPIVILSRGYGSSGKGTRRVFQDSSALDIGDEPLLLKKNLPFAEVYVGKNRYESYFECRKDLDLPPEKNVFVLLDDGFQHHALSRDLDIVLLDSTRLDKKEFPLPLGLLRETYSSVSRADFIVASKFKKTFQPKLSRWIDRYKPKHILKFYFLPEKLISIDPSQPSLLPKSLKGKSVFAFSGLGNPGPFWDLLNELEVSELEIKSYLDHYSYTKRDLSEISETAKKKDFIVCTEKDAVKISHIFENSDLEKDKWYYLKLGTKLEDENVLLESVRKLQTVK